MMKKLLVALLVLTLLPAFALAEERAAGVMELIGAQDFEAVYALCDDTLQKQLGGADALASTWAQMETMFGAYAGYAATGAANVPGYDAQTVECAFASATATLILTFDAEGRLAGLVVSDYAMKAPEAPDAGGYAEESVVLRPGEADETNGLLTLPEGEGPFPCVVMMQGSGVSDMNETVLGIPVFQELARALARAGIASIRYDKYPYAHIDLLVGDAYKTFTVDLEYAKDAGDAAALLDADARISSVYLLGHSLGAMVAPRVADQIESAKLAGMVLLAGTPGHMYEIVLRQLADAGTAAEELKVYEDAFAAMNDMPEAELQATDLMGAPLFYWKDEAAYDYAAKLAELNLPIFVAQGAKDFQVLPAEGIEAYRAALAEFDKATYKLYADMTHLLYDLTAEYTATAADYANLDGLTPDLAPDIAEWILAQ